MSMISTEINMISMNTVITISLIHSTQSPSETSKKDNSQDLTKLNSNYLKIKGQAFVRTTLTMINPSLQSIGSEQGTTLLVETTESIDSTYDNATNDRQG